MAGSWRSAPGTTPCASSVSWSSDLVYFHALEIAERLPPGLLKRWPGYAMDRCVREPDNLNHLLCGSEGTLAAITSAELKIVPLPKQKGLALIFFASVAEAMQATVELLDLKPAAIEHMDRVLLDQTRGQLEFQAARDLLELEFKPCQSILVVEFFEEVDGRFGRAGQAQAGVAQADSQDARRRRAWSGRCARPGLSLMTGRKGDAKPVTGIEDTAVRPEELPAYVAGLQSLMAPLGLQASYYGHAAAGLLHVRPDARPALGGGPEEVPPARERGLRPGPPVQGLAGGRARRRHRADRVHGRAARRRPAGA